MIRVLTLALTLALALAAPALASPPVCGERDVALRMLSEKYDEQPEAVGLGDGGHLYEILVSEDRETWTILVTTPQGVSCMVASGRAWLELARTIKGEGS